MKNSEIKIPILNDEYKVIVCFGEAKDVSKVLKRRGHSVPDDRVVELCADNRGLCFYDRKNSPVIAMPRPPKTPDEIGTLAHEATHAIEHIFGFINQPIGGEIFAHSVGAVVRGTLRAIRK